MFALLCVFSLCIALLLWYKGRKPITDLPSTFTAVAKANKNICFRTEYSRQSSKTTEIKMMGRFNPMASTGNSNHNNQPPPVPTNVDKDKGKDNFSISSIASMATMGKSMTKSLGAGLHTVANAASLPNPLTVANNQAEIDKKTKQAATEKKQQISQVLSILEDVHLQCPPSHSGIIVAYTGASCAPIVHPGIRFTWFRMSGEDKVEQVDESAKAWYAPTVDDIGAVICAQCEDNYYQGCSRYIECGPIKADALLCSQAESTIENGSFEARGVSVSLGLGQAPPSISAGDVHGDDSRDSLNYSSHGFPGSAADTLAQTLSTVLSKKVAFLQFDGRSTVEVDEQGIFISIPTADPASTTPPGTAERRPSGLPGMMSSAKKTVNSKSDHNTAAYRSKFKAPRRGLRIPGTTGLKVTCAQPLSLVLSVPVKREDGSESADGSSRTDDLDMSEEERMRRFLSSSTVSIPWTYEGHNYSPEAEAFTVNDPNLTYEEKQDILREAERDAVVFANTVVALAEFISALPEGTKEICICFSCPDRLVRDCMVLSVRGLAAMPTTTTRFERKAVFPWLMHEGDETLVAESNENETQEAKRLLKAKEEENLTLKRERNELTVQLLESREELVAAKQKMTVMQNAANKQLGQTPADKRNSGVHGAGTSKKDEPFAGFAPAPTSPNAPSDPNVAAAELGKAEAFKQLSSKIIELENKLSIATKREAEFAKSRADVEARNTVLNTDLNKVKKSNEEITRKLASLQSLSEAKTQSIALLERDQEQNKVVILDQEIRLKEVEVLRGKLEKCEATLAETEGALAVSQADGENYRSMIGHQAGEIAIMKDAMAEQSRVSADTIAHLEKELGDSIVLNHEYEAQIAALQLVVAERDQLLVALEEAGAEKDRLNGELNALQQKSASLARDLQKQIKDSGNALTEFEKALVRKSEECNELYVRVNMWEKAEEERIAQENNSISNRMLRRISSIHMPEGVLGNSEHSSSGKASGLLRGIGSKNGTTNNTPSKRLSGTGGLV